MIRSVKLLAASVILFSGFAVFAGKAKVPSFAEFAAKIRPDHPRLFISPDEKSLIKERANGVCRKYFEDLKSRVDTYPENPQLAVREDIGKLENGILTFKKNINDQNAVLYALRGTGGVNALECAIVYFATGEEKYRLKALKYLDLNREFFQLSDRSKIMPEWFHFSRLAGITAWDWLYDTMTPEERSAYMKPMLEHVAHMQKKLGYQRNVGGSSTGNYGEPALQFYAGVAAYRSGINDALALQLLEKGYNIYVGMMDYRDHVSENSGLLTSVTTAYSFAAYPWGTFNFMHVLRSAAGIDSTEIWSQMLKFPEYTWRMMIPDPTLPHGFAEFGWGDGGHTNNAVNNAFSYTHMAQIIHFYSEKYPETAELARAIQEMLPAHRQTFNGLRDYPFTPYILTGFDPSQRNTRSADEIMAGKTASNFSSYGVTVMSSGTGKDATYASFKGGSKHGNHQHYDENSFIIYKHGFQALDTGTRGNAYHHKVYYPQTVAHNSILIRMKDEPLPNFWYPANAPAITRKFFCDGGQNMMMQAKSLGFYSDQFHVFCGSDATACYSAEKCKEAVRQFVFIKPDYFVIYDRVTSVLPDQEKVFLLHTAGKPETDGNVWRSENRGGAIFMRTLLPEKSKTAIIGGKGREFWTNGANWEVPEQVKKIYESGNHCFGSYRLEISPEEQNNKTRFLHVIQAGSKDVPAMVPVELVKTADRDGVRFRTAEGYDCELMFNRSGNIGGTLKISQNGKVLVSKILHKEQPAGAVQKPVYNFVSYPAVVTLSLPGGVAAEDDSGYVTFEPQKESVICRLEGSPGINNREFVLKPAADGMLNIKISAPVNKDKFFNRNVKVFQLFVNGRPVFPRPQVVSSDTCGIFNVKVQAGKAVKLRLVFQLTTDKASVIAPKVPVKTPAAVPVKTPASLIIFTASAANGEVNIINAGKAFSSAVAENKTATVQFDGGRDLVRGEFIIKAVKGGKLDLQMSSGKNSDKIRFFQVFINGKPQFGKQPVVSADAPVRRQINCRDGEEIKIRFVAKKE